MHQRRILFLKAEAVGSLRLCNARRPVIVLAKAHVSAYTKKDGTFVVGHERADDGRWFGDARHVAHIMAVIAASPHRHHGIRVMTPPPDRDDAEQPAPGARLDASFKWRDGEPTQKRLKGTSALRIKTQADAERAIQMLGAYWGRHVVLVGSDHASRGADEDEVVLRDPIVLRAWQRNRVGVGRTSVFGNQVVQADRHADHDDDPGSSAR